MQARISFELELGVMNNSFDKLDPIKLHRFHLSGHSHRVELFLSLLGLPVTLMEVNLRKGEHKTPEFQKLNPFGLVPVIEDGAVILADSNAILIYLAKKYGGESWLSNDPLVAAKIEQWLAIAAGLTAFGPAAARLITVFGAKLNPDEVQARAHTLLKVMNGELQQREYLAGSRPTIADIANYTYVAHAPEGDVSLLPYPHVRAWLARIESLPGFVPMQKTAAGCAT